MRKSTNQPDLRRALGVVILLYFSAFTLLGRNEVASTNKVTTPAKLEAGAEELREATKNLGSWIWAGETTEKQQCRFWRTFEIQRPVERARLYMTADNGYRVYLDGREIGQGSDWRLLSVYDLTWVLSPGTHILTVEAFNDGQMAGVIAGLRVEYSDGSKMFIGSDGNWRVVPESERRWQKKSNASTDWPKATIVRTVGTPPWWQVPVTLVKVAPLSPIVLRFWQNGWFQITLLSICGIAILACLRLMAKVALQSRAQQLLQLERARIARDIHDDLGAGLTQLVLLGEVAQSELPAGSETRTQIDQICERARSLFGAIDEMVWAVNSRRDTLKDFATYVCKYAQRFLRPTPIRCRFDVEAGMPDAAFELPSRRSLLLAVKEALNNAAKHSQATELFLRIHRKGHTVVVTVEDNGKGFVPSEADAERNGLTNMAQRMKELGGECRVSSRPGEGCVVEFTIPLQHKKLRSGWMPWTKMGAASKSTTGEPSAGRGQNKAS